MAWCAGGRDVLWFGGVPCYLVAYYEDAARMSRGNGGQKALGGEFGRWRRVVPSWDGRGALGYRGG